jgi:multiple sugar transport system substrate-binding protein
MKKLLALVLTLCMVFALFGGSVAHADDVTISLWTYPIGGWGNSETVDKLIADFEAANPGIKVTVEYLAYADGDDKVNTAIEGNAAPDLIMEGPERLVANWGAKGYMVDIAELWDDADKQEILPVVAAACFNADGASYEYPLCMTAHCMAVNLTRFQAVGADQYLNLDTHTWTTEDFVAAVALLAAENPNVAAIYCSGQGGDQGTRALVNNLYSGLFIDEARTGYQWDSEQNVKALQTLVDLDGVNFDASINGGDEMKLFRQGILSMAFCWNISGHKNTDDGNEVGRLFPALLRGL